MPIRITQVRADDRKAGKLATLVFALMVPHVACAGGPITESCQQLPKDSLLLQTNNVAPTPKQQMDVLQEVQRLPLCDPEIVKQTCRKFSGRFWSRSVTWAVLTDLLSASSLVDAREPLGLPEGQPAVGCKELCAAAVQYIRDSGGVLPPTSDVACRTVRGNTTCDVQVDMDKLNRRFDAEDNLLPDEGPLIIADSEAEGSGAGEVHLLQLSADGSLKSSRAALGHGTTLGRYSADRMRRAGIAVGGPLRYDTWEVAVRIANLFRAYPSTGRDVLVSWPKAALLQETATGSVRRAGAGQVEGVIAAREAQGKIWLATIIRELTGRKAARFRQTWFGGVGSKSAEEVRLRVLRTMNFIEEEMSQGMRYVYPADSAAKTACKGGVVAYVWRTGRGRDRGYEENQGPICGKDDDPFARPCGKDPEGRYFVYLCQRWSETPYESSQIAVLVHEAAHHAGPTDVTYNRETMKRNSQADQLNNAANYQNFAQDLTQSVTLAQPCADSYGSCQYYKNNGYCEKPEAENVRSQCQKTCGICRSPLPTPRPPVPAPTPVGDCADTYGSCQYYKDQGYCTRSDGGNVRAQCKNTCSLC
jgi:hypothetical protein